MTTSGQNLYKGINTQAWAAMSLFLQYINRSNFGYIGFEGDKLEDFHLVFEDGHKIICEAKASEISYPNIRDILENVIKHGEINQNDEVLIICEKVNNEARGEVENFKYFEPLLRKKLLKKKKFTKEHLSLLPKVKFWEVDENFNLEAVQALMAELIVVWVPDHQLKEITDSLVIRKVYFGSQEGATLSKRDFMQLLEERKRQIAEDSGYYDERENKEKHLIEILNALKNPKLKQWANNQIAALTDKPDLHYFALKKLEKQDDVTLQDWDKLWEASIKGTFSIEVFRIFEKNITQEVNKEYFLNFIPRIITNLAGFYRERFLETDIIKVCRLIIKESRKYDGKIFDVIKQLLTASSQEKFYVKRRHDTSWEREELAKLLEDLYENTQDNNFKKEIIKFIENSYNLVEDDGKFWHYTPPTIFEIVKQYVDVNVEDRILELKEIAIRQYSEFYKRFGKKLEFDGWELMGGGISQMGSEFSIDDKHFLTKVIKPVLDYFHTKNREKTWRFIKKNFISRKESVVSKDKPDFLNRAVIGILIKEYEKPEHKKEAFEILSDFIRMRKGIPWKADLIFQSIKNSNLTDDGKWALVKISLKTFKNLPVNVFIEQIVFYLVSKSHIGASGVINEWVKNPEYNAYRMTGAFGTFVNNLTKLLENKKTFNRGVEIFKSYIKSVKFAEKENDWDTWDVAKALGQIITVDPGIGLDILKEVNSSKKLTQNQQTLICSSINDLPKENKDLLKKVYRDFVYPLLESLDWDISKVEKRITNRYSREQIVQFAEKLAEVRLYDEALYLIEIFVNDSDPILENYPEDPKGDFNYHQKIIEGDDNPTISTVRGYCAWALQKFCIRYGRDYIAKILPLVDQLTKDPNYYVRVQACIPLLELVKNRHTILAENRKERFLPMEIAERIENITFTMLKDKENHKLKAVMKHLAMVFTYMRTLDEKQAMLVLKTFRDTGFEDVVHEAAPLYIFFAEFRNKSFKDWPWGDISKFDDKPFKALLVDLLKNGSPEIKSVLSWQFNRLPDEISKTPKEKSQITVDEAVALAVRYFEFLTSKYEHQVFNNIYRFIEDYIDSHFDDCFNLWTKCLVVERPFLTEAAKDKENVPNVYWWPFFYNGKILLAVAKHKGSPEYLKWFEFLADYPVEVLIANDLADAIGPLKKLPKNNKQVKRIFNNLIKRNANFLDDKQEWQKQ